MRKDKNRALALRREGKSYGEISKALGISKSTLSDWFRSNSWSHNLSRGLSEKAKRDSSFRIRLMNEARRKKLDALYSEAVREAKREFSLYKNDPLFISGIAVYWGEGDKVSLNTARISNTDPTMIELFVRFLRKFSKVEENRIRAYVLLYPDLKSEKCENFWRSASGLRKQNFNKSITIKGRHKTRRLKYGVCSVGVSSSYFKRKMIAWMQLLPSV